MKRQRVPYARRSLNVVVIVLAVVLVIGLAVGGYVINHQRTQIDNLQSQVAKQSSGQARLFQALLHEELNK